MLARYNEGSVTIEKCRVGWKLTLQDNVYKEVDYCLQTFEEVISTIKEHFSPGYNIEKIEE